MSPIRKFHVISLSLGLLLLSIRAPAATSAQLAMGFKVGEVTQNSAIVWTRVTQSARRKEPGYREPEKREPRVNDFTPYATPVTEREGAVPGAIGEVRVIYREAQSGTDNEAGNDAGMATPWKRVVPEKDFACQFELIGHKPDTRYTLSVEARPAADEKVSTSASGSFRTAAAADQWQDVDFGVITGQSYWDLDDPRGFHIYPAMQTLRLDFLVPTGDTVYYDSEAPRARTIELARHHWHRMYSLPRLVEFHRFTPGYWEKDDHDCWCDDCWPTRNVGWMSPFTFAEGQRVFREQVPMGQKTYRTVRWGRGLQIWLVEGRDFRSANDLPDGPEKSIWGRAQRDWLEKSILASDASFRVLISPTPIVGPDRGAKADNHANAAFAFEGNRFRRWTRENRLDNFFVCCGDRHWQYMSIDPETGLHEFSCGPASDEHAGGSPGHDPDVQPFHRVKGGFLSVSVRKENNRAAIAFRHHNVRGNVVHEYASVAGR